MTKGQGYEMGLLHRATIIGSVLLVTLMIPVKVASAADAAVRHQYIKARGLPTTYAGLENPIPPDNAAIVAARAIYDANCVSCHGPTGKGDGEDGFYYNPKPTDLTSWRSDSDTPPDDLLSSDQYLYWTISEGDAGVFETSMASFKSQLTDQERWKLVLLIRHGL
jgi:mono/diheme cytochrome c family protein